MQDHVDHFDQQAWSIFLNLTLISEDEIAQENAFLDKIKDKLMDKNQEGNLDMRSQFRLSLLLNILASTQAN